MSFPKRESIFQGSVKDVRETISRPSLDTLYEVRFSFDKQKKWLQESPFKTSGDNRSQGQDFLQKMSLMCTQAEIPGTSFVESTAIGHRQGIQESFPNLRNFPPLNLVFYCDADHLIMEVFDWWMTYINPIETGIREKPAYSRFNYPDDYKETIHLTKFERDTFGGRSTTNMSSYEFVNIWPSNMTSMRVAYGDSNVLRCTMQFIYDRFHTEFNYADLRSQKIEKSNSQSKDIVSNRVRNRVRDSDLDFDDANRILNRGSSFAGRFSENRRTSDRNIFVQQGF